MKILELTPFSAGACGVWARAKQESELLARKGHEVKVFSSNFVKGTNEIAPPQEISNNVEINRFPARKLGGESFMHWNFYTEAIKFNPDVIICHSYRHPHTTTALKVKNKINCKVFLVTHAPFVEKNTTRSFLSDLSVSIYDTFIGPRTMKKFDKIITITKWEIPYLKKIGVSSDKIVYIPNGVPKEFFTQKKSKEENKVLFLGRISPIKNLEVLIKSIPLIKDKKIKFELVGPAEEDYLDKLKSLANSLGVSKRIIFSNPVYDLVEKIKKIDSAKVFVLPSKREAMPQALIEAMAREKIVISSNNPGSKEIVQNEKNGFIFEKNDPEDLAKKISLALSSKKSMMKEDARKSVEKFNWNRVIRKIEKLINT